MRSGGDCVCTVRGADLSTKVRGDVASMLELQKGQKFSVWLATNGNLMVGQDSGDDGHIRYRIRDDGVYYRTEFVKEGATIVRDCTAHYATFGARANLVCGGRPAEIQMPAVLDSETVERVRGELAGVCRKREAAAKAAPGGDGVGPGRCPPGL